MSEENSSNLKTYTHKFSIMMAESADDQNIDYKTPSKIIDGFGGISSISQDRLSSIKNSTVGQINSTSISSIPDNKNFNFQNSTIKDNIKKINIQSNNNNLDNNYNKKDFEFISKQANDIDIGKNKLGKFVEDNDQNIHSARQSSQPHIRQKNKNKLSKGREFVELIEKTDQNISRDDLNKSYNISINLNNHHNPNTNIKLNDKIQINKIPAKKINSKLNPNFKHISNKRKNSAQRLTSRTRTSDEELSWEKSLSEYGKNLYNSVRINQEYLRRVQTLTNRINKLTEHESEIQRKVKLMKDQAMREEKIRVQKLKDRELILVKKKELEVSKESIKIKVKINKVQRERSASLIKSTVIDKNKQKYDVMKNDRVIIDTLTSQVKTHYKNLNSFKSLKIRESLSKSKEARTEEQKRKEQLSRQNMINRFKHQEVIHEDLVDKICKLEEVESSCVKSLNQTIQSKALEIQKFRNNLNKKNNMETLRVKKKYNNELETFTQKTINSILENKQNSNSINKKALLSNSMEYETNRINKTSTIKSNGNNVNKFKKQKNNNCKLKIEYNNKDDSRISRDATDKYNVNKSSSVSTLLNQSKNENKKETQNYNKVKDNKVKNKVIKNNDSENAYRQSYNNSFKASINSGISTKYNSNSNTFREPKK